MTAVRNLLLLGALGAAAALTACSGGSGSPASPVVPANQTQALSGGTSSVPYGSAMLSGATLLGRAKLNQVGADVWMKMSNAPGLIAYASASNNPKNALFRHWLTPQQLGDQFGAPAATYAATAKYFASLGIGVNTFPQRQMMHVNGPQAAVEHALGLQFGVYKLGSRQFIAPIGSASPGASLQIASLGGVIGYTKISRRFQMVRASSSLVQGYSAQQIAQGFDYNEAYAAGYKGDGITIGIIGTGPITDGDPRFQYGDVAEYKTLFSLSGTGTVVQDIDLSNYASKVLVPQSGLATPPPVTSPVAPGCQAQGYNPSNSATAANIYDYDTCNPEDIEAQLDTEQASALAPDATVNFYIAFNNSTCAPTSTSCPQYIGIALADDEIEQAIADNASDVISMSFGEDEPSAEASGYITNTGAGPGPTEYASLASEGIAEFAASGDSGAEECQPDTTQTTSVQNAPCVNYPATDPSVVSAGGVNAPFNSSGGLNGPITGWGEATQIAGAQAGASGGGCSIVFSEPAYGANASLPCGGKRTQPDAALDADTNTGVAVVIDTDPSIGGRAIGSVGGTSVATPEFAAMWALVLQACKASSTCGGAASGGSSSHAYRLGNPDNYLYPIYENSTEYPETFYDVLFGNNSVPSNTGSGQDPGFTAGQGYDQVTGIGVPYGYHLIQNVISQVK